MVIIFKCELVIEVWSVWWKSKIGGGESSKTVERRWWIFDDCSCWWFRVLQWGEEQTSSEEENDVCRHINTPTLKSVYEKCGLRANFGWMKLYLSVTQSHTYIDVESVNRLQVLRCESWRPLKIIWTTRIDLAHSCEVTQASITCTFTMLLREEEGHSYVGPLRWARCIGLFVGPEQFLPKSLLSLRRNGLLLGFVLDDSAYRVVCLWCWRRHGLVSCTIRPRLRDLFVVFSRTLVLRCPKPLDHTFQIPRYYEYSKYYHLHSSQSPYCGESCGSKLAKILF